MEEKRSDRAFWLSTIAMRLLFFTGAGILIAGSVLAGHYDNPSDVSTGYKLAKAGDIIVVAVVAWITAYCMYLLSMRNRLSRDSSQKVGQHTRTFQEIKLSPCLLGSVRNDSIDPIPCCAPHLLLFGGI